MTLRILHLSDLHLGPEGAWAIGDYSKTELIDEAQRLSRHDLLRGTLDGVGQELRSRGEYLDAVIISGDVAVRGQSDGFEALGRLLGKLGDRHPGPDKTVVVPGNHDVAWGTPPDSPERYQHFLELVRAAGYVTPLLEGIDIASSDGVDLGSPRSPFLELDGAVVVAMNSANYCGTLEPLGEVTDDDLADLRAEAASGNGALGRLLQRFDQLRLVDVCRVSKGQTEALGARLRKLEEDGAFRLKIAVLHHQLLPVSLEEEVKPYETMVNLGFVRQWLADVGFDVVIHGHKHSAGAYIDLPGAPPFFGAGEYLRHRFVLVSSVATANSEPPAEIGRLIEIESPGMDTRSVTIRALSPTYPAFGFDESHGRRVAHIVVPRHRVEPRIRFFEGTTVDDVYQQLVAAFPSESYDTVPDVICRVVRGDSCHRLPAGYPVPEGEDGEEWFAETVAWWQNPEPDLQAPQFNHGERISRFASNVDQFELAMRDLASRPQTSRGIVVLLDPREPQAAVDAYPALCLVQFRIPTGSGRLDCVAYFRKQQMRAWWPINVGELALLQRRAVEHLGGVVAGEIVTVSALALGGSDRPRVAVPRVDRWSQDQPRLLWDLALATLNIDHPRREEVALSWQRLFSDWHPRPNMERDGVPVALRGLDALADAVETCAVTFPHPQAAALVAELRDLARQNRAYWRRDSSLLDDDLRLEDFRLWQPSAVLAIDRVLARVDDILTAAT